MLAKFSGCMIGSAIGDAIGELKQHYPTLTIRQILERDLKYTDDTALSLAVAEAILSTRNLTTKVLGDHFLTAINAEPWRGHGEIPLIFYTAELKSISYLQARNRVNQAFRDGQGSYGDGAAMRIAPAGLYYSGTPQFARKIRLISEIDHNHELAVESALVVARTVSACVLDQLISPEKLLAELTRRCRSARMKSALNLASRLRKERVNIHEADLAFGNVGRSHTDSDSVVGYALFCFLKNLDSFENCLEDAISTNGDADTIAAIACAMSGSRLGIDQIPKKFYLKLENGEHILNIAARLLDMKLADATSTRKGEIH